VFKLKKREKLNFKPNYQRKETQQTNNHQNLILHVLDFLKLQYKKVLNFGLSSPLT